MWLGLLHHTGSDFPHGQKQPSEITGESLPNLKRRHVLIVLAFATVGNLVPFRRLVSCRLRGAPRCSTGSGGDDRRP